MASKKARETMKVLRLAMGARPNDPVETEDKARIDVLVADSGEISIYATRVPGVRAVLALQALSGQLDDVLLKAMETKPAEATTEPHGDALGEREKLLTAKTVRHLKHIANEPGVKGTWCGADRDMWRDTWNRKSATCKECLAAIALASKPQAPGDGNG